MTVEKSHGQEMASVRRTLRETLPADVDFEAFCLDCFRSIHRDRFTQVMDRTQKESILLQCAPLADIQAALQIWHQQLHSSYASDSERQRQTERRSLSRLLQELYERKETMAISGQDSSEISDQILSVRRELRHGPLLHAGEVLGDRFVLERVLGSGGFASAWRAYDRQERTMVAVKVLHGQWSGDSSRIERFYRGARRMAQLSHPAIVRVIHTAQQDAGFHYFATEYLVGGDLRRAVLSGQMTRNQAVWALISISDALDYAHQHKMIHRDVKPSNILLDDNQNAKLGDFDLVYAADSTGGTRTTAIGSVYYAAPEAMENAKLVDNPRSDVYSLGMTLAFIMHGSELPHRVWADRQRFLRSLQCSPRFKAVIERATDLAPQARYESAHQFSKALRAAIPPSDSATALSDLSDRMQVPRALLERSSRGARILLLGGGILGAAIALQRMATKHPAQQVKQVPAVENASPTLSSPPGPPSARAPTVRWPESLQPPTQKLPQTTVRGPRTRRLPKMSSPENREHHKEEEHDGIPIMAIPY